MAIAPAPRLFLLLLVLATTYYGLSDAASGRAVLAAQGCECGCLIRNPWSGGCSECKPHAQCKIAQQLPCSCPTGHVTSKWDKQRLLEARFCAGNTCSPTGCCGGVRYGRQEGGTEALNMATETVVACAACTGGCGACAAVKAVELIQAELTQQVLSIVEALRNTASDLSDKASEFGDSFVENLKDAITQIAEDIVRTGKFNRDSASDVASSVVGNCRFQVEPGFSTYTSKTCVWCCNCVNNLDAVRFYLAWRLDCSTGGTATPVALPPVAPPPEPAPAPVPAPPTEICEHDCKRCGQGGPCAFGKCSGPCKKCCWQP